MAFAADRYEKMIYRRCGRSGLKLPVLSLGYWQSIGREGNEELCRSITLAAFDAGITHFDFANNYGPPPGHAEIAAAPVLAELPREEIIVSTKAGYLMWPGPYGEWGSRKSLMSSLDHSLKRLGMDYVDIYYSHRFDPETPLEETLGTLEDVIRQGKALYAGVSSYNATQFREACRIVRENGWHRILIHQPVMNMLVRDNERELLPVVREEGVGVIAFCPLAQGILTDSFLDGVPEDSRRGLLGEEGRNWYNKLEAAGAWSRVRALNDIARDRGQT
ncbi:MAG: aldo/keto reductase, partial [Candidatus Sumerlaeia bacterium]|nr:aldo/keto reductase [Candidatus Sumerlaeia bacterium]